MYVRLPEAGYLHADQACYLCHRVEDVIDTTRSIEGEGILAICTNCVREMAQAGGMDPDAEGEVEQMATIVSTMQEDRDRAVELAKKLRKQLRTERTEFTNKLTGSTVPDEPVEITNVDLTRDGAKIVLP